MKKLHEFDNKSCSFFYFRFYCAHNALDLFFMLIDFVGRMEIKSNKIVGRQTLLFRFGIWFLMETTSLWSNLVDYATI
jgi:hypothetical protein